MVSIIEKLVDFRDINNHKFIYNILNLRKQYKHMYREGYKKLNVVG